MTTRSRSAARTANDQGSTSGEGPLNVTLDANEDIVCTITNTRETGTIEVIKDLEPDGDPGLFNLQIDGTTEEGNAGDGGTTTALPFNTGTHSVGETAGTGTSLDDYEKSISCVNGRARARARPRARAR